MNPPSEHRLFGFHDVCEWDRTCVHLAALRVRKIDRPPVFDDRAEIGIIGSEGHFFTLAETQAFNFPQGARQLWAPSGNGFWFNQCAQSGWIASFAEVSKGGVGRSLGQALYTLSPVGSVGYGLNFARLNRLGGYGYVGLPDPTVNEARPQHDGVTEVDLETGRVRVLVSIGDASAGVNCGQETHHYLTHIVPNPSGTRLLFLHRWWLPDGGIGSRLLSCVKDGKDLRCHAEGFLSHFDWWDEHRLIIWGRLANKSDQLRRLPSARRLGWALKIAKSVVQTVRPKAGRGHLSFVLIDVRDNSVQPFWPDHLTEDGHPMFCPADRDWLSIDTYPDADRVRQLKLLHAVTGQIVDLGRYQYADLPLDRSLLQKSFEHVDPVVLRNVDLEKFAWARSGLHCDLHPRWKPDGTALAFDSTHEGHRDIYVVDTSRYVTPTSQP